MRVTDQLAIRVDDLSWRFVRAPGPGGQNVNGIEAAAYMRALLILMLRYYEEVVALALGTPCRAHKPSCVRRG